MSAHRDRTFIPCLEMGNFHFGGVTCSVAPSQKTSHGVLQQERLCSAHAKAQGCQMPAPSCMLGAKGTRS